MLELDGAQLTVHRVNIMEPVTEPETGDAVVDYSDRGFVAFVTNIDLPQDILGDIDQIIRKRLGIRG